MANNKIQQDQLLSNRILIRRTLKPQKIQYTEKASNLEAAVLVAFFGYILAHLIAWGLR